MRTGRSGRRTKAWCRAEPTQVPLVQLLTCFADDRGYCCSLWSAQCTKAMDVRSTESADPLDHKRPSPQHVRRASSIPIPESRSEDCPVPDRPPSEIGFEHNPLSCIDHALENRILNPLAVIFAKPRDTAQPATPCLISCSHIVADKNHHDAITSRRRPDMSPGRPEYAACTASHISLITIEESGA